MTGLLQDQVVHAIAQTLKNVNDSGQLPIGDMPVPIVEPPKRPEWGDFSCNVAMTLASRVRQAPLKVANVLATALREQLPQLFAQVDVAPPGFLNLTLQPTRWIEVLQMIHEQGVAYGTSEIGKGKQTNIEFVSANPTGPLHVGHGRGAALGQALSSLLSSVGFQVSREFYINDAGRQLQLLGRSVFARYQEYCGKESSFPDDGYHGTYIKALAERVAQAHGQSLLESPITEAETVCAHMASQILLERIKQDLAAFGVGFETWFSEALLHAQGLVQQTLDELRERDLLKYDDGAWWFRSSVFGDEKDRVVKKKDGAYTYLAADMAYHRSKLSRGFETLINIWGADHHGYVPRMEATVQAFGHSKESLKVVLVQMVSLRRGTQKIEMSKRTGEFVTLREVLEEVGSDAAKFFFLMRRADTHLDFDLELAKQQSADNPVYYVQYAHARLASLFRIAEERQIPIPVIDDVDHTLLLQEKELGLIKILAQYPLVIEGSANALEPHRVTFYLQELAAQLHAYYNKHRVLPLTGEQETRQDAAPSVRQTDHYETEQDGNHSSGAVSSALTQARLALLRQVQVVIRNGLTLLGISSPEKM